MAVLDAIPRRCVNLPPGSIRELLRCAMSRQVIRGADIDIFYREFAQWLGVGQVIGAASGRSAFQMALEALELPRGAEIIFPSFTFPVVPLLAKSLGYTPVFCPVDTATFNAGPEHIEPLLTDKTAAVLATHLFGRPCPIEDIVTICRPLNIYVLEDCAHACGVRIDGRQVGTFGDIGIFSFAQGKNMPCFGGGAVATDDAELTERLRKIEDAAAEQESGVLTRQALSIWFKWLVTRPRVFSLTAYPILRLGQALGRPLMENPTGNDILGPSTGSNTGIRRFANLQAVIGRLQLAHIDAFNRGAQKNGEILNAELADVPGIETPAGSEDHIYVYYPLRLEPGRRDDLRNYLLRHGIDTKRTDMSDCSRLTVFRDTSGPAPEQQLSEASFLEICVFPAISESGIRRIARTIRRWAGS